mgnify:CR=1 FL=1
MKITLEPTDNTDQHHVTLTLPGDDNDIDKVAELFEFVLLAWGFHPDNVKQVFRAEDNL